MAVEESEIIKGNEKKTKTGKEFWKNKLHVSGSAKNESNHSCELLKEKGNTSEWSTVETSVTGNKCKAYNVLLPVAVIIIVVVTSQGCQAPKAYRVREKYLCTSIHPNLKTKSRVVRRGQEGVIVTSTLTANLQSKPCREIASGKT